MAFRDKDKSDQYYRQYWKKVKSKKPHLLNTYGITIDDYNSMFTLQDGRCAGCNKHQSEIGKTLHVDHDHETKVVRGLLCNKCNMAIGLIKENVSTLKEMIKYLENAK